MLLVAVKFGQKLQPFWTDSIAETWLDTKVLELSSKDLLESLNVMTYVGVFPGCIPYNETEKLYLKMYSRGTRMEREYAFKKNRKTIQPVETRLQLVMCDYFLTPREKLYIHKAIGTENWSATSLDKSASWLSDRWIDAEKDLCRVDSHLQLGMNEQRIWKTYRNK